MDSVPRSHAPRGNAVEARCAPWQPVARAVRVPTESVETKKLDELRS